MKPEKQLYQWDVNQYLTGINPAAQYVDYTIGNEVIRIKADGARCRIPDEVLQTYGGKTCYERYPDGTYRSYSFTVLYAPKPPDYVYTAEERTTFDALVAKADAAIEEIKRRADSGEFTPVKGVDYFTDAEKAEMMESVSSGAVGEFRKVVDTATTEYNVNHTEKMTAYDTNASEKLTTYDTNAEQHTTDYNRNAEQKLEAYNQNHTEKVAEYNANAETKTAEFDSNAAEKLKAYNDNADNKVAEFDSHTEQIQTDINGLRSDLANKLPKSPADWKQWTAEEQAMAKARMGIGEERLIFSTILAEDTQILHVTKDINGNSFNLSEINIYIYSPVSVNDDAKNGYVSVRSSKNDNWENIFGAWALKSKDYEGVASAKFVASEYHSSYLIFTDCMKIATASRAYQMVSYGRFNQLHNDIVGIRLMSNGTLEAGTEIVITGVNK